MLIILISAICGVLLGLAMPVVLRLYGECKEFCYVQRIHNDGVETDINFLKKQYYKTEMEIQNLKRKLEDQCDDSDDNSDEDCNENPFQNMEDPKQLIAHLVKQFRIPRQAMLDTCQTLNEHIDNYKNWTDEDIAPVKNFLKMFTEVANSQ